MLILSKKKALFIVFLFIFLGVISCQKPSLEKKRTIKLLPLLSEHNIELSPFKAGTMTEEKEFFPVDSLPLETQEGGLNPYGLKRRLHMGPIFLTILYAPPESSYSLEITIPPDSYLEFGVGLVRDKNFEKYEEKQPLQSEGVEFLVELQKGEYNRSVFQKFVRLPEEKDFRTVSFSSHQVDLPPEGGKFRLSLKTKEGTGFFAFWHSPVIVSRKKEPAGVILISLDTLRADHLSCYGYHRPTSPAIDSLAADSTLFAQTLSASNWTLPAHASLLTSTDPPHHGVRAADDKLPSSLLTLAEVLSQNGFFCGAITGGGFLSPLYGFARGFDFYNEAEGAVDYENSAELVCRAAERWLEDNKDKDFFLFLHTYQIHSPYDSPAAYRQAFLSSGADLEVLNIERYLGGKGGVFRPLSEKERENIIALYDAEIKYTDEALVGELIKWLQEKGLYDRLTIVLTSDHGEEFYEHGAWVHGAHLYQESIRVPLIIKFPEGKFKGKRVEPIVRLIDVAPTILEALGIKSKPKTWDGRSLYPFLEGQENSDRVFLADTCWLSGEVCGDTQPDSMPISVATSQGKMKVIINRPWPDSLRPLYQPGPADWPPLEVYNLEMDAAETKNLSSSQAAKLRESLKQTQARYRLFKKLRRLKVPLSEEQLEKLRALGYIH